MGGGRLGQDNSENRKKKKVEKGKNAYPESTLMNVHTHTRIRDLLAEVARAGDAAAGGDDPCAERRHGSAGGYRSTKKGKQPKVQEKQQQPK